MKNTYEVYCGNIGNVHAGNNKRTAIKVFNEYKRQSKKYYGKAANEDVILFVNGEIEREYLVDREKSQ